MTVTDAQVRITMRERNKGRIQEQAAASANVRSRQTVAKYEQLGEFPNEQLEPRQYRTWTDVFAEDWSTLEAMLEAVTADAIADVIELTWQRTPHISRQCRPST